MANVALEDLLANGTVVGTAETTLAAILRNSPEMADGTPGNVAMYGGITAYPATLIGGGLNDTGNGGSVFMFAYDTDIDQAGGVIMQGGSYSGFTSPTATGGDVTVSSGYGGIGAAGGNVRLESGGGNATGNPAASITITAGSAAGASGLILLTGIPGADPNVTGAMWNSGGTLKISAG